jgi:large subunit ribosomal protein L18
MGLPKASGITYDVHFRRRREGRTDYAKRLALLKSGKPRMVVRKTNKNVTVQFAQAGEKGDTVISAASTAQLKEEAGFAGKCNTPSAYLAGMLAARKAAKAGVKEFVLDIGLQSATKGSVVFAALKGAVDAGLETPFDPEMVPSDGRIRGEHTKSAAGFEDAKKRVSAK